MAELAVNFVNRHKSKLSVYAPLLGLVFVALFFGAATEGKIFELNNLVMMLNSGFPVLIIAIGAVFIYSHGGMDFSMGSVMALGAFYAGTAINATNNLWLGAIIGLVIALVFSLTNIFVTIKFGLPSFITSLCISFIARGLVTLNTISPPTMTVEMDMGFVDQPLVKLIFVLIILTIASLLFRYTRIGIYNKAIGGNIKTARLSGIDINKYRIYAYLVSAVGVGSMAFFALARGGGVSRQTGLGLELDVMIALVMGGVPLTGGTKVRMSNVVIGSVIMVILTSGLARLKMEPELIPMIKGIVFLIVVFIGFKRSKGILPR